IISELLEAPTSIGGGKEDLNDVSKLGELLLNTGLDMLAPSQKYVKEEVDTNVRETQKLFLFLSIDTYAKFAIASTKEAGKTSTLEQLKAHFQVIPVHTVNKLKAAFRDSDGLKLLRAIAKREMVYDEYVMAHKILDHL
ncbi:26912_t:CDS:2, partial [Racocetra persica]